MLKISNIVSQIDSFVWGPVMLVLLVGTGVLLTVRDVYKRQRLESDIVCTTVTTESNEFMCVFNFAFFL